MNFQVGPGGQILNITGDAEQKCDFPGSPQGRFFFVKGGPEGGPGPPGRCRDSRAFVNASLRDDASLSNRFAFESLRFVASLSNRFAFESLRFESLRFRI